MRNILAAVSLCLSLTAGPAALAADQAPDTIPKCWKLYNPKLHDGLYHITIPANDSLTAKDVQAMILSLQAFGVASHTVMAIADSSILLEAQFWTLDQAKAFGYPTQDKLEGLVAATLQNDAPYLGRGVTITCFKEHKKIAH